MVYTVGVSGNRDRGRVGGRWGRYETVCLMDCVTLSRRAANPSLCC
ncbi:MAG: hypothetical protein ACKERG_03320 [Candidatus Hodgkinia cicadicola]